MNFLHNYLVKPIIINPNRYNNIFQDGGAGNSILQNFTSTEFKLKIVEEAKELDNNTLVARKHGISEGAVRSWRKNEDKLSKHSSEIRGLCSTKCSSEMLQNLLYFMYKKLENPCRFFRFSLRATLYFYLMNALVFLTFKMK